MAMSANEKIRAVNERFKQSYIGVDFDWLSGCVDFFCEESPAATIEQLFEQAHEQWLLSDLKDSGSPCWPNSIFSEKQAHTISGKFPMQIQYLIDIAESAYDQLQRLHNKQLDEGKEQQEFKQTQATTQQRYGPAARGKRVMKLELFDGQRKVTAMEYRPIPCLSTKLTPGTKVLLSGPMRCVNHVLLLEPKNVQLLGGEVELLTIENAFENVLLRKLNRPLNEKPKTDYPEEPAVIENGVIERPILPRIPMTQTQRTAVVGDSLNDDFDDELLLALDNEQLSMLTNQQQQQPQQLNHRHSLENRNEFDSFGDLDDSALLHIDEQIVEMTRAGAVASSQSSTAVPAVVPSTVVRADTNSVGAPHQNNAICNDDYPFKIRGINFVFIEQLNKCPMVDKLRRRLFMIKVEVIEITETAQIKQKQWSLGVVLTDHVKDGMLQVRFSNDVLEKLTGHTAIEVQRMFTASKTRPHIAEDLNKILAKLSKNVSEIHSYMKIEYTSDSDNPIVLDIIEPAPVLEQKLQEKLKREYK